jgi:hypothetical protein
MLDDREQARLERLWAELHYVSQDTLTIVTGFEQLMEFATQDADPTIFEPLRESIYENAAEFQKNLIATEPKPLQALLPVDPAAVLATTVDVGADRSTLTDDIAISPNAAVCSSCHTDSLAAEHMKQNGGDFAAGKDDSGVLISSGVETCQLCHGPGRANDVKEAHGVGEFLFN